ncbi:telomerase Cajal body protein 1 homolog isoform X2 [Condylostylus longicornis]|uniref:telomerase Cajal body protein 1 homolog isoform X2 n=1 Tax=Condylostylus longicornis TaxID=2530218 RepID=UPI00244DEF02|nr:telomerase Cajal body protein 1 homolog isoform X2 [Condylostylus longicornis]
MIIYPIKIVLTKTQKGNDVYELSDILDLDILKFEPTSENFSLFEIGRAVWKSDSCCQRYLRGCLWSPDGTCVLTAINGEGMQVFELPSDLYQTNVVSKSERELNDLAPAVIVPESGTVYDYNWFPQMNSNDPSTCCWIASRQHEPIHMWDAFTGELRGTYRGYDQFDEVETSISCIFSPTGEYIIGGYKKSLKVFQTSIPGRDYIEIKSKNAVSALSMHYNHPDMIVSGSWNSTINIYDIRATNLGCLTTIPGHSGGVTLLKVDSSGQRLFSGARKDKLILQWDLRNFKSPVQKYFRQVETNQRIYFDISVCGKYLLTGGTDGMIRAWDITSDITSEYQFNLHYDCCNSVGFSTIRPVICTTSGQYKFTQESTEVGIDSTNLKENEIEVKYENSLVVWWYGHYKN